MEETEGGLIDAYFGEAQLNFMVGILLRMLILLDVMIDFGCVLFRTI